MEAYDTLYIISSATANRIEAERERVRQQEDAKPNRELSDKMAFLMGLVERAPWRKNVFVGGPLPLPILGENFNAYQATLSLDEINNIDDMDPGKAQILWAGDDRGVPLGVTVTRDRKTAAEVIEGTPTYPLNGARAALLRSFMPDKSAEEGGGRPTQDTQVARYAGHLNRRYSLAVP